MVEGTLLMNCDRPIAVSHNPGCDRPLTLCRTCCSTGSWISRCTSINITIKTSNNVQSTLTSTRRARNKKPAATSSTPASSYFSSSANRKTMYSARQLHTRRGCHCGPVVPLWYCSFLTGNANQQTASSDTIITSASGAICQVKAANDSPERPHRRIFCGLPIGVRSEPALTASASKMISRLTGISQSLRNVSVSGTMINSATSLVRNVDSTAAENTINSARRRSVAKRRTILRPRTSK